MPERRSGPVIWVRASALRVPRARPVPSGRVIRAAASASAGAGPHRQGAPPARYRSVGCPGSRSSRARRSSRQVRHRGATRGSSPLARAGANGLVAALPEVVAGPVPWGRMRSSTVQVPPGGSSTSQRSSPAEARASDGGGSAVTAHAVPLGVLQRRPEAWTSAGISGTPAPVATVASSARSVPRATSTGSRRGRAEKPRRVIRSVPSAWRTRSTRRSGSGPVPGEARTVPTNLTRSAATGRACTASGSRPATRTRHRESSRRPRGRNPPCPGRSAVRPPSR